MATLMYPEPDGHEEEIMPEFGSYFGYDEIRRLLGAGFDTLPATDGKILFFAMSLKQPRNPKAMELVGLNADPAIAREEDYIHGTVLVCEQHELLSWQH